MVWWAIRKRSSESPAKRLAAAEALGDSDRTVRLAAIDALERMGDLTSMEFLFELLHDGDAGLRQRALQALRECSDLRVALLALKRAPYELGECAAERLVGAGAQAVPLLAEEVLAQRERVGWNLENVLVEIGEPAVGSLLELLGDPRPWLRRELIGMLGKIGDRRAAEPIATALQDADLGVRLEGVEALELLADPRTVDALVAALEDENDHVRAGAVKALHRIGDPRAVPALLRALDDGGIGVSSAARAALMEVRDERFAGELVARLEDRSSAVRRAMAEALTALGWSPSTADEARRMAVAEQQWDRLVEEGAAALETLSALFGDLDPNVRAGAVEALGRIGDARAVERLLARLEDSSSNVRYQAALVVTALGWRPSDARERATLAVARRRFDEAAAEGSPGVEALVARLEDADWEIRLAVVHALKRLGSEETVEALARHAGDATFGVRLAVVEALGLFGDARAVPAVTKALHDGDEDETVRVAAGKALSALVERSVEELANEELEALLVPPPPLRTGERIVIQGDEYTCDTVVPWDVPIETSAVVARVREELARRKGSAG